MNALSWRVARSAVLAAGLVLLSGLALAPAAAPVPAPRATVEGQDFVFLGEARPVLIRMHVRLEDQSLQAASDDFMKYLFDYLDVNRDGVLSKEEARRAPTVELIANGGLAFGGRAFGPAGLARPALASFSTRKDGALTLAQVSAYYRSRGWLPFQFQLAPSLNPGSARLALFSGQSPEPSVEAINKAIFTLLDTNRDGKLTKDELAAAPAVLLRLDENEDDLVTTRELVPNTKRDMASMMAMFSGGNRSKATSNKTLVPITTRGAAPASLVSSLRHRYGNRLLKLQDRKLARKDLGLDEATFAGLDTNGDGLLDAGELAGFVRRSPDLELLVRFAGETARVEVMIPENGPSPLSGKVKKMGEMALLDLGVSRLEVRGNAEEEYGTETFDSLVRQQFVAQFKAADKDNNGYLDEKEAKANRVFRESFAMMDRDGDGKLYEKEVIAYFEDYRKIQKKATASCVSLVLSDQSRGLFDLLDVNRDGQLSVREMRGAVALLRPFDREGKGYLTRADIPRTHQLLLRRGPLDGGDPGGARAFAALYGGGGKSKRRGPAAAGPLWFRKMDRNRDGDVSRKEFLFSDEKFREIDTDGDGLISVAEAEAHDAKRRKQK